MTAVERRNLISLFDTSDGVDATESWMLARAYSIKEWGAEIGAPTRQGANWIVPMFVGRHGERGPELIIDSASGRLSCRSAVIDRPAEYLSEIETEFQKYVNRKVINPPNKAPEPTPGAVTPRATEASSK